MMKVGLKDISELSGFSIATVSNVLSGKKGVNEKTAEIVLNAARELGYLQEGKADKVRLVIYKKHGSVVGETPFFRELIEGVESECRSRGLPLEVAHLSPSDNDFSIVIRRIVQDPSSATLLLATELDDNDLSPFKESIGAVAVLDNCLPSMEYNVICINNEDSLINAVGFLVERGYSDFGYLKSSVPINNFLARETGFRKGMVINELEVDEDKIVALSPNTDGAYQDMKSYLGGNPNLPGIYIADNDIIALGAMKALQEFGVKIPEDVAMVGFDDMEYSEISTPTLSTIRVFKKELGSLAVKTLLDFDMNSDAKVKNAVSTKFIVRDSI